MNRGELRQNHGKDRYNQRPKFPINIERQCNFIGQNDSLHALSAACTLTPRLGFRARMHDELTVILEVEN